MSKESTDENREFEEALALQKEENEGEAEEYRRLLEIARSAKRAAMSEQIQQIIHATDDPIDDTRPNIVAATEFVVGPESGWCSGGNESKEFRMLMNESFEAEWTKFRASGTEFTVGEAMRKLPPLYFAPVLPSSQFDVLVRANPSVSKEKEGKGAIRARILFYDNQGSECSTMKEFAFSQTAAEALHETVLRIHSILNVEGVSTSEYMFRVVGRAEFVYGSEQLINFRHIRECIVKQLELRMHVLRLPFDSSVLRIPRFNPTYTSTRPLNLSHDELQHAKSPLQGGPIVSLSQWDLHRPLSFRLAELNNITLSSQQCRDQRIRDGDDLMVCVVVELVFGTQVVCDPQRTPWRRCRALASSSGHSTGCNVIWGPSGKVLFPSTRISDLPREVKICLSVVCVAGDSLSAVADFSAAQLLDDSIKGQPPQIKRFISLINPLPLAGLVQEEKVCPLFYLASASIQLFDHRGTLRCGDFDVRMWAGTTKANPIGTNSLNPDTSALGCRTIFPRFPVPVIQPSGSPPQSKFRELDIAHHDAMLGMDLALRDNKIAQLRTIKKVLGTDPLYTLSPNEKILLWEYRNDLIKRPKALAKFLLGVNWMRPAAVYESQQLMSRWALMQPMDALELLDARFPDTRVRGHAVDCLDRMPDYELKTCILQLVQALKYEPYHYSALGRFLLKRSLESPHVIGHVVFWHLKAEMQNASVCERHGLLLEELVTRLPSRRDLLRQQYVVEQLLGAAFLIKDCKKHERLSLLQEALRKIQFPPAFALALNPTMECSGLIYNKCKVMDSKKLPLWLVFKNADPQGAPIYIIFKAGDDLRQDLLTLQMLELMDSVWKNSGLDLHMIPYGCVATGEGVGMIEIVLSSDTIANITRKNGGAQAAFSEDPLMNWLRKFNRTPQEVERCLWNFVYSLAGYCVATYILGIGDRHNDNIMMREDGTLFHIDFGHFLGNFKTKFGFKRETAPFIFTPMMAYMLGGQNSPIYAHFCEVAGQAFNVIRRYSNLLITLFMLMLSTGIPELQTAEDIQWLKTVLLPEATDDEAGDQYKVCIEDALNNKRTLFNDYIHILAH